MCVSINSTHLTILSTPPTNPKQIEITREIGDQNIFLFGNLAEDVSDLRHRHLYDHNPDTLKLNPHLTAVFDAINSGLFGDPAQFHPLIAAVTEHGDYYLVSDDFNSYITTQEMVDEAFLDRREWTVKSILSVARMGFFSADRVVSEYAEGIWNAEPLDGSV